jgi:dipeptidyl aminopeptidase/acylaminoacyl peptidase
MLASSRAAPIPAEELFRSALLERPALSPNGERMAAVASDEKGTHHLVVLELKTNKRTGLRGDEEFDIHSFHWADDEHLLFNITREKLYAYGLYVAHCDHLEQGIPLNFSDVTQIIGVPQTRRDRALVWIYQSAENEGAAGDLVEFNTSFSDRDHLDEPQRNHAIIRRYTPPVGVVVAWRAGFNGELAACYTYADAHLRMHRLLPDQKTWQELPLDLSAVTPLGLDPDGQSLWIVTHDADKGYQLRRYNMETREMAAPILSDARYDLGEARLFFSERTKHLVGISYGQRRRQQHWFEAPFDAAQSELDRIYPATDNELVSYDHQERRFLFRSSGPQQPVSYLLLDIEAKSLQTIASSAPWLKSRTFAATKPISFHARDGVTIEGYLTLPNGASEAHPVPLVVLPHGGPWTRDEWEFDRETQFLASRGYAVLQPNYRGSIGYGPKISRDSRYDFRKMHDDVTDGTRAILGSKLIDPKRVAIMGGSFGGYLALAGVTFEDNLYCCAVTLCGVFDWETFIKDKGFEGRPGEYEVLRDKIGRPGHATARFEEISILQHAERIHVPLFIAHGDNDQIVDASQSRKLASVLKKRGVPYETFFRPMEGHGFANDKTRIEFYQKLEKFLARHLGETGAAAN